MSKIRQIKVRSALFSSTVNKLSRVFSLIVTFSDFLLNSCLKLVGTPGTYSDVIGLAFGANGGFFDGVIGNTKAKRLVL